MDVKKFEVLFVFDLRHKLVERFFMIDILFEGDTAHKDMVLDKKCGSLLLLLAKTYLLGKTCYEFRTHFTVVLFTSFACIVQQNDRFDQLSLLFVETLINLCYKRVFDVFKCLDTLDGV